MSAILCKDCSNVVPASDVDLSTKLARCRACNAVFDITPQLRGDDAVRRRELHVPTSIRVVGGALLPRSTVSPEPTGYRGARAKEEPADLELELRWFRPQALFMMFFAVIWCGFLVVWYSIALQSPSPGGIALWFPLLHVAVGVGLGYWSLAMLLNRTRIALGGGRLRVTHGPLPWRGGGEVPCAQILGFYVESRTTRGKRGRTSTSWKVCADVEGSPRHAVVSGLSDEHEARFLARALAEQHGVPLTSSE